MARSGVFQGMTPRNHPPRPSEPETYRLRRQYAGRIARLAGRRRTEDTMIELLDLVREAFLAGVTRDDIEEALG
jgi:hypothetical protein